MASCVCNHEPERAISAAFIFEIGIEVRLDFCIIYSKTSPSKNLILKTLNILKYVRNLILKLRLNLHYFLCGQIIMCMHDPVEGWGLTGVDQEPLPTKCSHNTTHGHCPHTVLGMLV
jgi:hypothetical protein